MIGSNFMIQKESGQFCSPQVNERDWVISHKKWQKTPEFCYSNELESAGNERRDLGDPARRALRDDLERPRR